MFFILLIILLCLISNTTSFILHGINNHRKSMNSLKFQKKNNNNNNDNNDKDKGKGGFFNGIKRFIPAIVRNRLEKDVTPETNSSNRYEVRLVNVSPLDRRHVTTRLLRYLPDLTYETAQDIVDRCIDSDTDPKKSLIRVFNSIKRANYLSDMLKVADPSIQNEIYDSKDNIIL